MKIKLNNYDYRYDVYQMINIFYSSQDIQFIEEDEVDLSIDICNESVTCVSGDCKEVFKVDSNLKFKDFIKKVIFEFLSKRTKEHMPWGTLTGIRPSKKALELLNEGKREDEIVQIFKNNHCTEEDKTRLCIKVARNEERFVNKDYKNISVYVGMPFCPTRCVYCSFASNPIKSYVKYVEGYLKALYEEMERMSNFIKERDLKIQCVYFGGGTPTSVNDEQFEEVMKNIHKFFIEDFIVEEFTVECGRPDSLTMNKLQSMKNYNVNRISINPQTMNDKTLKLIGRNHSSNDVIEKFNMARELGFDNINMDVIVGLPGENLSDVMNTCRLIKKLYPDSLTVHGLSVKRGSRLHENIVNNERYEIPEQEELNEMFKETLKLSSELHMEPYYMYRQKNMVGNMENIGYSKHDKECIYNIEMIEERQTIIALGADAVSKIVFLEENRLERFPNIKDVKEYIERLDEKIGKKEELLKTLY